MYLLFYNPYIISLQPDGKPLSNIQGLHSMVANLWVHVSIQLILYEQNISK